MYNNATALAAWYTGSTDASVRRADTLEVEFGLNPYQSTGNMVESNDTWFHLQTLMAELRLLLYHLHKIKCVGKEPKATPDEPLVWQEHSTVCVTPRGYKSFLMVPC